MSYIFPSGTKRQIFAKKDMPDFIKEKGEEKGEEVAEEKEEKAEAKEEKTEVADDNKDAVVEDQNLAFDAIKDLPDIKDKATALLEEIKGKVEEVAEAIQENVEDAEKAKAKVEEIAAVVGDGAAAPAESPAEVDAVELEIEDESPKEVDISVDGKGDASIPGVENKVPAEEVEINIGEKGDEAAPEDIVKKSEESCKTCGKEVCSCAAKAKNEFVRLAKLTPKNREAVKEYWLALGFPKDYVEAMVKDY